MTKGVSTPDNTDVQLPQGGDRVDFGSSTRFKVKDIEQKNVTKESNNLPEDLDSDMIEQVRREIIAKQIYAIIERLEEQELFNERLLELQELRANSLLKENNPRELQENFLKTLNDKEKEAYKLLLENQELRAELNQISIDGFKKIHKSIPKEKLLDVEWAQGDNGINTTIIKNDAGLEVATLKEMTQTIKLFNGTTAKVRSVDFPLKVEGELNLSMIARNEKGINMPENKAIYFSAHYDKSGKLMEIAAPANIQFTGTDDKAVGFIEHEGAKYYLPVTKEKYREMLKEVVINNNYSLSPHTLESLKTVEPVIVGQDKVISSSIVDEQQRSRNNASLKNTSVNKIEEEFSDMSKNPSPKDVPVGDLLGLNSTVVESVVKKEVDLIDFNEETLSQELTREMSPIPKTKTANQKIEDAQEQNDLDNLLNGAAAVIDISQKTLEKENASLQQSPELQQEKSFLSKVWERLTNLVSTIVSYIAGSSKDSGTSPSQEIEMVEIKGPDRSGVPLPELPKEQSQDLSKHVEVSSSRDSTYESIDNLSLKENEYAIMSEPSSLKTFSTNDSTYMLPDNPGPQPKESIGGDDVNKQHVYENLSGQQNPEAQRESPKVIEEAHQPNKKEENVQDKKSEKAVDSIFTSKIPEFPEIRKGIVKEMIEKLKTPPPSKQSTSRPTNSMVLTETTKHPLQPTKNKDKGQTP